MLALLVLSFIAVFCLAAGVLAAKWLMLYAERREGL